MWEKRPIGRERKRVPVLHLPYPWLLGSLGVSVGGLFLVSRPRNQEPRIGVKVRDKNSFSINT